MSAALIPALTDRKRRLRGQYVSSEELLLFQSDLKRERKLEWIADKIVCRDCAQLAAAISTSHLRSHREGMSHTQKEYRRKWPGAPVYSERHHANVNRAARKYIAERRPAMRERSANYRKNNPEKIKAYDRKKHQDPEWRQNRRTWEREDYYPRKKEVFRERRAAKWRPPDWNEKRVDWRIIGTELLLQRDYISNEELGKRLDNSRSFRCPYGPSWRDALSSDKNKNSKRATNLVNEIRRWVRRPGKVHGKLPVNPDLGRVLTPISTPDTRK